MQRRQGRTVIWLHFMYNPPSKNNWCFSNYFSDSYREAYDEGYAAAKAGKKEEENPHKLSGHERDTTFDDELHYWWWSGFNAF